MGRRLTLVETIQASFMGAIRERLSAGQRVRRFLPGGGVLHIERPLPFLVVYRRPADSSDSGTRRLVVGESAYLIAPADESLQASLGELVSLVVQTLAERFNAFLLLELWTGSTNDTSV